MQIVAPPAPRPITSPGNTVTDSTQPTPSGATVLAGPAVISGSGKVEADLNVSVPSPGRTTLAYYYDAGPGRLDWRPDRLHRHGRRGQRSGRRTGGADAGHGRPAHRRRQQRLATLTFSDAATIPTWAQAGVAKVVAVGIMNGFPDNTFRPDAQLTRDQMAKLIALTLQVIAASH